MQNDIIGFEPRDLDSLVRADTLLEKWGTKQLLPTIFALSSRMSALEIRNDLRAALDSESAIAVLELRPGAVWACDNADREGLKWLREEVLA